MKFITQIIISDWTVCEGAVCAPSILVKKSVIFSIYKSEIYFSWNILWEIWILCSGYKKADTGLSSKHSNGGSLDRYITDPNQRGAQARADIIRPRPTPCKLQIPHQPRKTSPPVTSACVYLCYFSFAFIWQPPERRYRFASNPVVLRFMVNPLSDNLSRLFLKCFYQELEPIISFFDNYSLK